MNTPIDYTDGKWIAMSVGQFCQILIDSGENEAILFRVIEDVPVDDKSFIRQCEVLQIPSGIVKEVIDYKDARVHKVLAYFLEKGLIK
jgi:hypothetical protein